MKRFALILTAFFLAFNGFAQKQPKFTEEDARQFYQTMQGEYTVIVNDSTTAEAYITPIWENLGNPYKWLYVEVVLDKKVLLQKVLELKPKNDKVFHVYVHDLKNPAQFVGREEDDLFEDARLFLSVAVVPLWCPRLLSQRGFVALQVCGTRRALLCQTDADGHKSNSGLSRD